MCTVLDPLAHAFISTHIFLGIAQAQFPFHCLSHSAPKQPLNFFSQTFFIFSHFLYLPQFLNLDDNRHLRLFFSEPLKCFSPFRKNFQNEPSQSCFKPKHFAQCCFSRTKMKAWAKEEGVGWHSTVVAVALTVPAGPGSNLGSRVIFPTPMMLR